MKKPLAALLLSVATVAALAVPAGAATRTTWRHYKTACPSGRNGVIVTEKWQGGEVVQSWVTNTCGKFLVIGPECAPDSQSDCVEWFVPPHQHGTLGEAFPRFSFSATRPCPDIATLYRLGSREPEPECP